MGYRHKCRKCDDWFDDGRTVSVQVLVGSSVECFHVCYACLGVDDPRREQHAVDRAVSAIIDAKGGAA